MSSTWVTEELEKERSEASLWNAINQAKRDGFNPGDILDVIIEVYGSLTPNREKRILDTLAKDTFK